MIQQSDFQLKEELEREFQPSKALRFFYHKIYARYIMFLFEIAYIYTYFYLMFNKLTSNGESPYMESMQHELE